MSLRSAIQCPYCGHIHSEKWFAIDDEWMELECAACGKYFIAEAEVTVTTMKYYCDR